MGEWLGRDAFIQITKRNIFYTFAVAALIGSALGWAVGNALATRHCRKCSEENNNTEADCTGDEGCEVKEQADNDNVCTCGRNISDIFKGF